MGNKIKQEIRWGRSETLEGPRVPERGWPLWANGSWPCLGPLPLHGDSGKALDLLSRKTHNVHYKTTTELGASSQGSLGEMLAWVQVADEFSTRGEQGTWVV